MKLTTLVLATSALCACHIGYTQGRQGGQPMPPEARALVMEIQGLLARAKMLVGSGLLEEAVPLLQLASDKEDARGGHTSTAKYELAKVLTSLNRNTEALAAYRRAFKWIPRDGDLRVNGPGPIDLSVDYAILLSRCGDIEGAKAMFYWAHRVFSQYKSRHDEPVPFLVIFDRHSEGVYWEYSPEKLEAAALMMKVMAGMQPSEERLALERVKGIVPDWFYPILWKARASWEPDAMREIDRAEAMARPGVERDLISRYRTELAAHKMAVDASEFPYFADTSPMLEGVTRRARMPFMRPNEEILRRISLGGSG